MANEPTINGISPTEAVNLLNRAAAQAPLPRSDHQTVQQAVMALHAYIARTAADTKPEPLPEDATEAGPGENDPAE